MKNAGLVFLATASAMNAGTVQAAVTISSSPSSNMTCSAGVCSPTAADAVLNAGDLEGLLASGNVKVTTTGSGVQASDIRVAAPLTWSSTTTLSLDAYKSIAVGRPVTVSGSGSVSLVTNDGGSGGDFSVEDKGRVTFKNLSSALTINGAAYVLVDKVAQLANGIAANPSGNFALAKNYNASRDGTYAIPPVPTVFSGAFNGLGNTISNLTINDPTENAYVGLFAQIVAGATLASIRLANENVTGGSGDSIDTSTEFIGGLVGDANGGTITDAFVSGVVIGGDYSAAGGLVGVGGSAINASGAAVSVLNGASSIAGGLVGAASSAITDSHATGNVSSSLNAGGLVGFDTATVISHSYATGKVTGTDPGSYTGGLVGLNQYGNIDRSYATGPVSCPFSCGGLAGLHDSDGAGHGIISQSYATGAVSSPEGAGGLVALNLLGTISNSYATGAVSAPLAGGLVGQNSAAGGSIAVSHSYSTGAVSGSSGTTGGLVGYDDSSRSIKRTYWDIDTSGIGNLSQGAGNIPNDPGIKGLSNAQLQSGLPTGFSAKIWAESSNINGGLPYLIANPPPK